MLEEAARLVEASDNPVLNVLLVITFLLLNELLLVVDPVVAHSLYLLAS